MLLSGPRRMMFVLAASLGAEVFNYDISSAFLYGALEPDQFVQMKHPEGFNRGKEPGTCCLIMKSLYGLKRAPLIWRKLLMSKLKESGFFESKLDGSLLFGRKIIIYVWVDDIHLIGRAQDREAFNEFMSKHFTIKSLGPVKRALGLQVERINNGGLLLHLDEYIQRRLEKFSPDRRVSRVPIHSEPILEEDEVVSSAVQRQYQEMIGCLNYICGSCRPDICFAVSKLGSFNARVSSNIVLQAKTVFEYLRGTSRVGLLIKKKRYDLTPGTLTVSAQSDSDYAAALSRFSRYCSIIYCNGVAVQWKSRGTLQSVVNLSSMEAELYGGNYCGVDSIHIGRLAYEMSMLRPCLGSKLGIPLGIDNKSAVDLILKGDVYASGIRHADIRLKWVITRSAAGDLVIKKVAGKHNGADIGTKVLQRTRLYELMDLLDLVELRKNMNHASAEGNVEIWRLRHGAE
jgi:hypothetical protein